MMKIASLRFSGGDWRFRVISRMVNWRSRLTRVATGDQMLFVARDLFRDASDLLPRPDLTAAVRQAAG